MWFFLWPPTSEIAHPTQDIALTGQWRPLAGQRRDQGAHGPAGRAPDPAWRRGSRLARRHHRASLGRSPNDRERRKQFAELVKPLTEAMWADAMASPVPVRGRDRRAGPGRRALHPKSLLGAVSVLAAAGANPGTLTSPPTKHGTAGALGPAILGDNALGEEAKRGGARDSTTGASGVTVRPACPEPGSLRPPRSRCSPRCC